MKATALTAFRDAALAFWAERDARERKMLMGGAAALFLIAIYLLFIAPALTGRAKLQKSLPAVRQQSGEMQELAKQAVQLRNAQSTVANIVPTDETVGQSLVRRGFKPQSVTQTGNQIRVQLQGTSFSALVTWLNEVQQESGLSVADAQFEATGTTDIVNATVILRSLRNTDEQE